MLMSEFFFKVIFAFQLFFVKFYHIRKSTELLTTQLTVEKLNQLTFLTVCSTALGS